MKLKMFKVKAALCKGRVCKREKIKGGKYWVLKSGKSKRDKHILYRDIENKRETKCERWSEKN